MELILTALPFLALLACPLMMVFCVFGMRKAGCSSPTAGETQGSREERVAALEGQLASVQAELTALRTTERPASASRPPESSSYGVTALPEVAHATQRSA